MMGETEEARQGGEDKGGKVRSCVPGQRNVIKELAATGSLLVLLQQPDWNRSTMIPRDLRNIKY